MNHPGRCIFVVNICVLLRCARHTFKAPYVYRYSKMTVIHNYSETSNKGHAGDNTKFTCFVLCREVVLFSEVQIVLLINIGKQNFRVPRIVHFREVYDTVSLSQRVHYRRFHCKSGPVWSNTHMLAYCTVVYTCTQPLYLIHPFFSLHKTRSTPYWFCGRWLIYTALSLCLLFLL